MTARRWAIVVAVLVGLFALLHGEPYCARWDLRAIPAGVGARPFVARVCVDRRYPWVWETRAGR